MRFIKNILAVFAVVYLLAGCVGLPNTSSVSSGSSVSQKVAAAITGSPTHRAIQTAVNWQMTLCILGGVACLAFGGLAIYGGQLLPGIKLVIAGILLPIAGIWWAYHWLMVTIIVLIALAGILLITHYSAIQPALSAVEARMKTVEARLAPGVSPSVPTVKK